MSLVNDDQQFLPLDSSVKASSVPQYPTNTDFKSDLLYGEDSDVSFLMSKISELQKNYIQLQRKYTKKIKDLKLELFQKHKTQSTLTQQLQNLSKQYQEHKNQIQKISHDIKKAIQQNQNKQTHEPKLKSVSPKNQKAVSPKRLIKKSLEIVKKQVVQSAKQISLNNSQGHNLLNHTIRSQKSDQHHQVSQQLTVQYKKNQQNDDRNLKSSNENSLNSSNQTNNRRKVLYSPTNTNGTNGPSPKKKLLFNSTKQLDLFSKPMVVNKGAISGKNSSPRRINISPTNKKQLSIQNNQISNSNKIELNKQLPIIQQIPKKLQLRQNIQEKEKNNNNSGSNKLPSPTGRKKLPSPQNNGLLRKKISNKNLFIQIDESIQSNKRQKEQTKQINQKTTKQQSEKIRQKQTKQTQKKLKQSPSQSTKNIKMSPQSKFSPVRKTLQHSPTHKKGLTQIFEPKCQKPKLFTNMREKIDDHIFK